MAEGIRDNYIAGARNFYRYLGITSGAQVLLLPTFEFFQSDPMSVEVLMEAQLYERADRFFRGMEHSPRLREYIQAFDQSIQFDPKDGEPFYLQIRQGNVDMGQEKKYLPNIEEGLYIAGDRESIDALLRGDMTLAEAIYHHRIQIPGYREKEPLLVRFSKLLRRGIEVYGLDHL